MLPNPHLKTLGFSDLDRVAIIHADDIGMCQATLPAAAELFEFGLLSSAALMVPCPWFPGAAAHALAHPDLDYGVHLTLNSEWDLFRWGPISTRDPRSGLLDEGGYFHNRTAPTAEQADLTALRLELDAQLSRAGSGGLRITHADTHMLCLAHPRLVRVYIEAARSAATLPVLMRPGSAGWQKLGLDDHPTEVRQLFTELEEGGLPMLDDFYMMNLDTHEDRLEEAKRAFEGLQPGFTHFILHPAIETPELKAMAPDWRCRMADYDTFRSEELRAHVRELGVQVVGYEMLRAAVPAIN
jgi:predicted glycoside hydrolase/deacetylase ChbG (UPF0249 family)